MNVFYSLHTNKGWWNWERREVWKRGNKTLTLNWKINNRGCSEQIQCHLENNKRACRNGVNLQQLKKGKFRGFYFY